MKKITLILSVVVMAVLLAFGAAAAEIFPADADKAFDITYTGTPGEYYAIVIVEGIVNEGSVPSISEDSIQYIDQKTAGANGTVSFENVLLFEDDTPATVFLGGSDLGGAIVLGWVNKSEEEEETFTVSGTVTSDSLRVATITLTGATSGLTYEIQTASSTYTIDVPADNYLFVAAKPSHLSYKVLNLEIVADTAVNPILKGGDINGDEVVNERDLAALLDVYDTAATEATLADINMDLSVNERDLAKLLDNYDTSATVIE